MTSEHPHRVQGPPQKPDSSNRPRDSHGRTACRVALFLMNDGEYQQLIRRDCLEAASRHGVAVEIVSAAGDSARQAGQIHAVLGRAQAARPDALLVYPVRESALLADARLATRLGVGWVLLGRWSSYLTDMRAEAPELPIFSVAADQVEIGRIQAQQISALMPHGGELVCIRGALGVSSTTRRFEGLRQNLDASSFNLFSVNADWTAEGGASAMTEWLQIFGHRKLPACGVAAQNDAMAMGAKKALDDWIRVRPQSDPGPVPIVGCDGTPSFGQHLVREKELAATVIMPPTAGRAIDEVRAMLASHGSRPEAEVVLAPSSFPDLKVLARLGNS